MLLLNQTSFQSVNGHRAITTYGRGWSNVGMRCCIARQLVLALVCFAGCQVLGHAQSAIPSLNHGTQEPRFCPPVQWKDRRGSGGPEISIAGLSFSGFLQMPISDQEQIAGSITQRRYAGSLDQVKEEVEDRRRSEWQKRGYFKAQVSTDANVLNSNPA